jgi:hypothetical protein
MSVATPASGTLQIRLDRLLVPDSNVREYDEEWVESLRRSIRARGKVVEPVPVFDADPVVHGDAFDHVLIAGFHRERAARLEGLLVIPGFYGDPEEQDTDRAIENIMKKRLNAYQEAKAVQGMLKGGKTVAKTADLLDWDQRRVTARVKLLELPERAQQLVGAGVIALSAVEPMREIARVNTALLQATLDFVLEHDDELDPDDLAVRPLELLGFAVEEADSDIFLAHLSAVPVEHADSLQLDESTLALIDEANQLNKRLFGASVAPRFRFSDAEADRARAAGVLIEHEDEVPLVTDLELYQDLCASAIAEGVRELRDRVAEHQAELAAHPIAQPDTPAASEPTPPDELSELERKHGAAMRALAASAHSANLALGDKLRSELASVDPADINLARFFVYALLGEDAHNSYKIDNPVSAIALRGIRLVVGDFRENVTKTLQDGSPGVLRITYGDGREHSEHAHWLWKYLAAARTAGELYGRALVLIAAEHYASRLALPAGQQHTSLRWPSHKETAIKALEKLAGTHIAPTLKALERAIAKTIKDYEAERTRIIEDRETHLDTVPAANAPSEEQPTARAPMPDTDTDTVALDKRACENMGAGDSAAHATDAASIAAEQHTAVQETAAGAAGGNVAVIDASEEINF